MSPLAGQPTADLLGRRGYRPVEFTSILYRPLATEVVPTTGGAPETVAGANPSIEVRPITPEDGPAWVDVTVRGWSDFPGVLDYLGKLAPVAADREDGVSLLALKKGVPIAAGALALHGGVALLAGASTVPEARRRGAQRALLQARLDLARRQGCDVAMMGAQPGSASQRNAERQGFRVAYTRVKWGLL